MDTEILRESQEILDTIPLSVDQQQKLEGAVLSLQGRIRESSQRLIDDELQLEQSFGMDQAHGPIFEDLAARLEGDEQTVEQWIEEKRRHDKTLVPDVVGTFSKVPALGHSSGLREGISEKIEALQNRLDDMHQRTAFDSDPFRDMVNAELDRCVSRSMAKNVLDTTELYSLELLEEELMALVEKLDESERKVRVLEARQEARSEELRKWMEEDARVYPSSLFLFSLLRCATRTRSKSSKTRWKLKSSTREPR